MSKYEPQPGTIPARVIDHLRGLPPGTQLRTAELVHALGLEIGQNASLQNYLKAAVANGVLVRQPDPIDQRRSLWWLGDGVPVSQPKDKDAAPFSHIVVPAGGHAAAEPERCSSTRPPPPSPSDYPPPRFAIWSDGVMQIEHGDEVVTLERVVADALVAFIKRGAA